MTSDEKDLIRKFAAGDASLKQEAVGIHRRYIPTLGTRATPEQDFMAEIDTPCPDLALRAIYRQRLLAS